MNCAVDSEGVWTKIEMASTFYAWATSNFPSELVSQEQKYIVYPSYVYKRKVNWKKSDEFGCQLTCCCPLIFRHLHGTSKLNPVKTGLCERTDENYQPPNITFWKIPISPLAWEPASGALEKTKRQINK